MSKLNEYQRTPGDMPSEQSRRKAQAAKEYIENMYKLQQQSIQERMERCAPATVCVTWHCTLYIKSACTDSAIPFVGGSPPLWNRMGCLGKPHGVPYKRSLAHIMGLKMGCPTPQSTE